jgi:hypothetical protein
VTQDNESQDEPVYSDRTTLPPLSFFTLATAHKLTPSGNTMSYHAEAKSAWLMVQESYVTLPSLNTNTLFPTKAAGNDVIVVLFSHLSLTGCLGQSSGSYHVADFV